MLTLILGTWGRGGGVLCALNRAPAQSVAFPELNLFFFNYNDPRVELALVSKVYQTFRVEFEKARLVSIYERTMHK